jgi:hypothetical protein
MVIAWLSAARPSQTSSASDCSGTRTARHRRPVNVGSAADPGPGDVLTYGWRGNDCEFCRCLATRSLTPPARPRAPMS